MHISSPLQTLLKFLFLIKILTLHKTKVRNEYLDV